MLFRAKWCKQYHLLLNNNTIMKDAQYLVDDEITLMLTKLLTFAKFIMDFVGRPLF